ncbi:LysR family transcriptional regulator [Amycolatopsis sp. SID8362]|uniref:LysR family transcriptional regulator n=1 Tax=Amycolatopsis sp. SID8362 TaxID=2690346 RepID=UPI00136B7E67|nr:LysR family transcriptional regulator [Amycolatopsis sp. SID8362]NBH02320.1 LysR family transcriptional regulator [Amycolatopsis sp. SID8362]NED39023.1 LysR family transcriptional regulator [Amycolatopsis sp. SID8362]
MNLATLDLNLLVTLDALLQQRSVTRAAEQLGLSQPAVSAQLARLRRHFHDELLTRVGNASRLTPLAVQLKERVGVALAGVDRVFTAAAEIDPAATTREFSFVVSDYAAAVLGPALAAVFDERAPGARLRLLANTPQLVDAAEQVLAGIDLLLLPHGFLQGLRHQDLYTDEWVCLVSADNPEVGDTLTAGQLETMPWVATYHGPTASTPAARQMRMLGIEPRVRIVTESFLAIPGLVAGSGRVALLQRRLADRIPAALGVRALPCPFEVSPLLEAMWWHPIHDDDPEHRYLRELVAEAAVSIHRGDAALHES